MNCFSYHQNRLFAEDIAIDSIIARYKSPCYIYSKAGIESHWQAFNQAFGKHPHLICYAVKVNANIAVLNILARLGSGFDVVSLGEIKRVLMAGGAADKIVFSGVGKREDEIIAALKIGIHCLNIESSDELNRVNRLAGQLGLIAPVALRVNPDVDAKTHPHISTGLKNNKFGITIQQALAEYQRASKMAHINIIGIDCHIGSQLTDIAPFLAALDKVLALANALKQQGIHLRHLDLGGGLGIRYKHEQPPTTTAYVNAILQRLTDHPYPIILEPGRAITGNSGILVTRVEYLKRTIHKNFAIVDAAMNDLIRPSLYDAWQDIIPVNKANTADEYCWDIVGPICETADFLGKDRLLKLNPHDLLAVCSTGAYGFAMSSNYNARPRPAEVLVAKGDAHLIRERETIPQLWQGESLLPSSVFTRD